VVVGVIVTIFVVDFVGVVETNFVVDVEDFDDVVVGHGIHRSTGQQALLSITART
jgi:hypothetical protein|tara:strand:- start:192 stop:356 length:165 start_codon:yes stop_codon:yes gene_type:complete